MQNGAGDDVELTCSLVVRPTTIDRQLNTAQSLPVYIHLPPAKDQPLLLWWDTRLLLDFLFDPSDLNTGRGGIESIRICGWCLMDGEAHVPCHLDLYPAQSLKREAQDRKVSPVLISLSIADISRK